MQKNSNTPRVSVIILNYNGLEFLEPCLASVLASLFPQDDYEVILVDNCSTDQSADYVRQRFPTVKILELTQNYGFTGGNNRGARAARGKILVFLNNDTTVDRNWVQALERAFSEAKSVGVCGSKVLLMDSTHSIQYDGGTLHLIGGAIPGRFCKEDIRPGLYRVGTVLGAAFAIQKEVFEDIGGFDEDFFLYADEGDLCLRAWMRGHQVAYSSESIVFHHVGGSTAHENPRPVATPLDIVMGRIAYGRLMSASTIYYGNRNSIAIVIKNFEPSNLVIGIIFSYGYLLYQLFILLKKQSGSAYVVSLIRAGIWPIRHLGPIWQKRVDIQRRRKVSDRWLSSRGLLLSVADVIRLALSPRPVWTGSTGSREENPR